MHVTLRPAIFYALLSIALSSSLLGVSAQESQTFTGVITDDQCAGTAHAAMRMDPSDAECTRLCVVSHGAQYVLEDGKDIYLLSDQQTPERFAAQRVRVVGTLDAATKTIKVQSMAAAK